MPAQSFWSSASALLTMLLSLAFVLFLAWFVLKYIGKRGIGTNSSAGAIKVLDRVSVGKDQSLLLVKVSQKIMLVAFSAQGVSVLCELENDDELLPSQQQPAPDFSSVLKMAATKWPFKGEKQEDKHDEK